MTRERGAGDKTSGLSVWRDWRRAGNGFEAKMKVGKGEGESYGDEL